MLWLLQMSFSSVREEEKNQLRWWPASVVTNWEHLASTPPPNTSDEARNLAVLRVTTYVTENLLQKKVLLLPDVHDLFLKFCKELIVTTDESTRFPGSAMWVLSNLAYTLQQHLVYTHTKPENMVHYCIAPIQTCYMSFNKLSVESNPWGKGWSKSI